MNTLRILKGNDIDIKVDGEMLCFVTDFLAQESSDVYEIEEFLSEDVVDSILMKKCYELNITALTHLDGRVFDKERFTVSVSDKNKTYVYSNCRLKSKVRDVTQSKPIVDKYTIVASNMQVMEG